MVSPFRGEHCRHQRGQKRHCDVRPGVQPKCHGRRMSAMNWLFKEEPSNYSFDAFVKDKRTTWSGVKNPVAQRNLRSIKKGDQVFYYHTGDEKQIVGMAKALGDAYPDPDDKAGKAHVVDIGPVKKLARPVTLKEIKADA